GANHFLHAGRERNFEMIETFLLAITDRSISKKRRVTFAASIDDCVLAADIEIGLLLARETRLRQILRGGAAALRDIDCAFLVSLTKIAIRFPNLFRHFL